MIVVGSNIWATLLSYLTATICILVSHYIYVSESIRNKIRTYKKEFNGKKDIKAYMGICEKILDIDTNKNTNINETGSNIGFLMSAIFMFITCIVMHLTAVQKSFWIYTDCNDDKYAMILESNDFVLMKKVDIDEDNITIYLDRQLYMKSSDLHMKYISFKNITKK